MTSDDSADGESNPWSDVDYAVAAKWTSALEAVAVGARDVRCPVNNDGVLNVHWNPTKPQRVRTQSIDDVVSFVMSSRWRRQRRLPYGRHAVRCSSCGEVRHLVVMRNPSSG